jgi:hypothetical protein
LNDINGFAREFLNPAALFSTAFCNDFRLVHLAQTVRVLLAKIHRRFVIRKSNTAAIWHPKINVFEAFDLFAIDVFPALDLNGLIVNR